MGGGAGLRAGRKQYIQGVRTTTHRAVAVVFFDDLSVAILRGALPAVHDTPARAAAAAAAAAAVSSSSSEQQQQQQQQ